MYFLIIFSALLLQPAIAQQKTFNWNDTAFEVGNVHHLQNLIYYDAYQLYDSNTWKPYDTLVLFMKAHPNAKIEIDVHTSPQGSYKHNMALSQATAQMVTNYLIKNGVDSVRIVPKGFGSTQPLPGCSANDIAVMKTNVEKEAAYQADRRMLAIILDVHYKRPGH